MDVFIHYGIGGDNQSYLCLKEMKNQLCPICEEIAKAKREGEDEYASEIRVVRRVLVWIIDRKNEEEGPVLWSMPWTVDRDCTDAAIDEDSGEIMYVDDPGGNGYDIRLSREGSGITTKYGKPKILRHPSPLSDDEEQADDWLTFVQENPLPSVLNFYDYDYIKEVFSGTVQAGSDNDDDDEDDDDDSRPTPRKVRHRNDDDDDYDDDEDDDDVDKIDDPNEDLDDDEDDYKNEDEDKDDDDDDEIPPKRSNNVRRRVRRAVKDRR